METKQEEGKQKEVNVLPGPSGEKRNFPPSQSSNAKKNYSGLSIFMSILLFVIIVMLGERLIFDLNRFLNPAIDDDYTKAKSYQKQYLQKRSYDYDAPQSVPQVPLRSWEMASDSAATAPGTQIYYASHDKGRYMMYKLIIHAAFIIPVFVLSFVLFYFKKENFQLRPLLISFIVGAFWLMFHLLGETVAFVMNEYRNIAIYVILVVLLAVFGALAYYSQIKYQKAKGVE